jgi:general secretion pathway protein G
MSMPQSKAAGFTLIELMIVVAIIGILATIAMPAMRTAPLKAREAVLREDLFTIRSCIDQYLADRGQYPASLEELTDAGYLRFVPVDPITREADSWVPLYADPEDEEELQPTDEERFEPGMIDVRSGAEWESLDGSLYSEW